MAMFFKGMWDTFKESIIHGTWMSPGLLQFMVRLTSYLQHDTEKITEWSVIYWHWDVTSYPTHDTEKLLE